MPSAAGRDVVQDIQRARRIQNTVTKKGLLLIRIKLSDVVSIIVDMLSEEEQCLVDVGMVGQIEPGGSFLAELDIGRSRNS